MSDDELLAGFQAGTLEEFPHRAHVHVAWLYLRRDTPLRAIERFTVDLRHFALTKGRPGLYHETLTLAFLFLIHERMAEEGEDFDGFQARNPDLFRWKPSVLDRYYRKETLASELARRKFLLPDRLTPGEGSVSKSE
jgi:hypothetical protein